METTIIEKKSKYDSFTQKDMEGLKWCLKARSKDTTRPIINHILIDDGLVVATDGHRVHLYLLSELDLASGEYEIITVNIKQIILRKLDETSFPDYMRVMPPVNFETSIHCKDKHTPLYHTVYNQFANDTRTYDTELLGDAFMGHAEVSICSGDGCAAPLVLYDNNCRAAIVMPLKN
jgi:hypothetical protein